MMDITSTEPLKKSICRLIGANKFHDEDLIIFYPQLNRSYRKNEY